MELLTKDDMDHLLAEVSYRPGWEFKTHFLDPNQGLYLSVFAEVPDAKEPQSTVVLRIHIAIPPMRTAVQFYDWLGWRLSQIEVHESMEFFQINGKPYRDPHRDI